MNRNRFQDLLDAYWNTAYSEGARGATADTEDGRAGRLRHAIMREYDKRTADNGEAAHEHVPKFVNPAFGLSYTVCTICRRILDGTPPPPGAIADSVAGDNGYCRHCGRALLCANCDSPDSGSAHPFDSSRTEAHWPHERPADSATVATAHVHVWVPTPDNQRIGVCACGNTMRII